jgi:WD40 repeat protein
LIAQERGVLVYTDPVFSPDGNILAVNREDQVHLLANHADGSGAKAKDAYATERAALKNSTDINDIAFSTDGHWLVTGSASQAISLWSMDIEPTPDRILPSDPDMSGLTEEELEAKPSYTIASAMTFFGHAASVAHVRFSRDGRFILSASSDGTARLWRTTPGIASLPTASPPPTASAAGSAIPARLLSYTSEGGMKIWERRTGRLVASAIKNAYDEPAALSPDGRTLFLGVSQQHLVRQLDTETGAAAGPSIPVKGIISSLALSPDGSKLFISSDDTIHSDDTFHIWDVHTGKSAAVSPPGFSSSTAASVSAAGQVAVGVGNGDLAIWTPSKDAPAKLKKSHVDGVTAVSFAHNKDEFVSLAGDNTGRIWNAGEPGPILRFERVTLDARAEYSPDDRLILTTSAEAASIWDASTGQRLLQLPGKVQSAGWSPDGRRILMITDKGPQFVNVGVLFGEALRAQACDNRPRDFTEDERRTSGLSQTEDPCAKTSFWRRALDWVL